MTEATGAGVGEKHGHCWHYSGRSLMSMPPIDIDVCCHCNESKQVRWMALASNKGHGPFVPKDAGFDFDPDDYPLIDTLVVAKERVARE